MRRRRGWWVWTKEEGTEGKTENTWRESFETHENKCCVLERWERKVGQVSSKILYPYHFCTSLC